MIPKNHHLGLLRSAVLRMVSEDPLFFIVQVSRKLPSTIRTKLGSFGQKFPNSTAGQFLQFLADMPVDITHHNGLSDELRALKGEYPGDDARVEAKARFEWNLGNVTKAISMLPEFSSLRQRFEGEKKILTGTPLSLYPHRKTTKGTESSIDILHVLVNSTPHTASGYTVRTHAVLGGQLEQGWKVAGVTRIGYPITIGKFFPRPLDIVESIPYFRLLPTSLPASPFERLSENARMLSDLVDRLEPRYLHATTNYSNGMVAEAVARAHGIPWVYEMRGQLEKTWVARHPAERQSVAASSERYAFMQERETALAHSANAVIVLSQVQKNDLIERGIGADKIHVIPNAYTPVQGVPKRTSIEARKLLDLPEAFTIGTVTSVVDYEGLDTLVRAIGILRSRSHDVRAIIVGDGVSRPGLEALACELGLMPHVSMPGRVAREESHAWYQALDVFAIPRKDTLVTQTITPIKPIEAMSNATPIVASDLPPLRELVVDSGAGVAFEPENSEAMADAIEMLMTNRDAYESAGKAGIANAKAHTWDVNMGRYARLYNSL